MSKILDGLLTLAESQVGYTEKNNDKDLDAITGSTAGDGNHTKYARDISALGLPGYCGSAWCAVYQMWLEIKTVGKAQALKNMGTQFYNCFAIRDYAKSQGRWIIAGNVPKVGYLVIFKQSHIARVTKVSGGKIYTNEGNTSNGTAVVRNGGMVCNKSYLLDNSNIQGYVIMTYPEDATEPKKSGWYHEDGGERFYNGDTGLPVRNDWLEDAGSWYWFDGAGLMVTNKWYMYNDYWYYLGPNGRMVKGLKDINGKWYYLGTDGKMATEPVTLTPEDDGSLRWPGLANN